MMFRSFIVRALMLLALAGPTAVLANEPPPATSESKLAGEIPRALQGIPLRGNEFSVATPLVQVDLSNEDKVATVKFGSWSLMNNESLRISAEFKAPFDKTSGSTELADFDGLKDNTTGTVMLSYMKPTGIEDMSKAVFTAVCKKHWLDGPAPTTCSHDEIEENAKEYYKKRAADGTLKVVCDIILKDKPCTDSAFAAHVADSFSTEADAYVRTVVRAHLFSLRGEYGKKKFEFFDGTTLAADIVREDVYSISGGYGYLRGSSLYGIGFQYLKSFKNAKEQEFCIPSNTPPGSTRCNNGPVGGPGETERHNVFVEWRWQPTKFPFAISPRAVFDFKSDEWAFRLPVYFFGNKDDAFTGGIRLDWDTEQEDLQGTVFVGKTFAFF